MEHGDNMKVVCIADTHTMEDEITIPECDMLIHAGDFSYMGRWADEVEPFLEWFAVQPAKHKILICGNHEVMMSKAPGLLVMKCKELGIEFLRNEHTIKAERMIFGSPYSVKFGNWAYGLPDDELQDIWNMINPLTEILVIHGPPFGILDKTINGNIHVGSKTLEQHIKTLPNVKLVVCGHIHEAKGILVKDGVTYVNAAIAGFPRYQTLSQPIVLELE
jgi:Icc-related predicted phosphoesterase